MAQVAELIHLLNKSRKSPVQHWKIIKLSKKVAKMAKIEEIADDADARPRAKVTINGKEISGLLDSGACISCFGKNAYETLQNYNIKWKECRQGGVQTASGQAQQIEGFADVSVTFREDTKNIRMYIIPSLSATLYLGVDFWMQFDLLPQLDEINTAEPSSDNDPPDPPDMHTLNTDERSRLDAIIQLFPSSDKEGLGKTTLLKHHIDVGDARPTKQRYHAVSPAIEQHMFAEVDRMLELDIIEESSSPWNSPVTIVAKPDGRKRLCLDARRVNEVTVKDAYPMPLIDSIMSRLNETRYISSVDLKDAFWQIELDDTSREKTAFTVPGRPLYQFKRMPFGLCNAAQSMCRLMDLAIPSELRGSVFVYIDDLLVVAEDLETHLRRLKLVAESLKKANLTINVKKSKFAMRSIKYLGHIIGNGEIKPDPGRVNCISDFPTPKTIKQVRRFLGMTGWYQRYINAYSTIAAPITDLLKKADRFQWTAEAQTAFEALKDSLTTAPVLTHPDFEKHFYIQCDASLTGVGGVLFQIVGGDEHPIAYMSKKLNSAQKNYSVSELECLAAILCVQKFRCYVEGMPFTIITDHASLKWLMSQKDLTGRLARWSLKLQCYDFNIEHRKGSANIVPDTLSRMHIEELIAVVGTPISLEAPEFKDDEYEQLIRSVKEHADKLPDVKSVGGAVYKRTQFRGTTQVVDSETIWKLWVPTGLRIKTIEDAHIPTTVSHGGTDKTIELVRRHYYWPGLSRDVRAYVANCATCKETKASNQTLRPPMGKAFITNRPFQHIYVDLLGPYPRSKAKNTTILVMLDQLTKFVWLKPLRVANANVITRLLEAEVFHVFGVPESLLTDNGVQFCSSHFRTLLERYGVRHIKTGSHAPQANASERVNRSVLAAIRAYVGEDQSTWDVHLSAIGCALRNAQHATIGHSPYFAAFGQHMVQHAATYAILRELHALGTSDVEVVSQEDHREALNVEMRNRLQEAHDRNETNYNLRSRDVSFRPGQEVFIRSFKQSNFEKGFNAKLSKQWISARIVAKVGASLYEVEEKNGKPIKVKYHAKDIRM